MNVPKAHLKLATSNYSIVKCQLEICRPGGNIGRRGHLVESAPPNGVCLSNSPTCCNLLPPTILPSRPPLNPQPRHPPTSQSPYSISTSSLPTPQFHPPFVSTLIKYPHSRMVLLHCSKFDKNTLKNSGWKLIFLG